MRLIALVVGLVVCGLVVSVGAQEATPVSSPAASPVASDIGKTVRYANFDVTLVSAEFADEVAPDFWRESIARGKFLVVWMEITNRTLGPIGFPAWNDDDVQVTDSAKRSFTTYHDAMTALMLEFENLTPTESDFQPDIPYPYALVFDVAQDASGFTLSLSPSITFTLGI